MVNCVEGGVVDCVEGGVVGCVEDCVEGSVVDCIAIVGSVKKIKGILQIQNGISNKYFCRVCTIKLQILVCTLLIIQHHAFFINDSYTSTFRSRLLIFSAT